MKSNRPNGYLQKHKTGVEKARARNIAKEMVMSRVTDVGKGRAWIGKSCGCENNIGSRN